MTNAELKARTKQFALRIIKLVENLPKSKIGDVIGHQLLRSATSVGANYRAACRARSQADFISKITIVEEEGGVKVVRAATPVAEIKETPIIKPAEVPVVKKTISKPKAKLVPKAIDSKKTRKETKKQKNSKQIKEKSKIKPGKKKRSD